MDAHILIRSHVWIVDVYSFTAHAISVTEPHDMEGNLSGIIVKTAEKL